MAWLLPQGQNQVDLSVMPLTRTLAPSKHLRISSQLQVLELKDPAGDGLATAPRETRSLLPHARIKMDFKSLMVWFPSLELMSGNMHIIYSIRTFDQHM